MQWFYKKLPLKDYLASIIKDKNELKYLYSTVRRILSKEYKENTDLDLLISDVLTRDKIKKIINGEHVKQKKQAWNYQRIPLKRYLSSIVKNEEDLEFLYKAVKAILEREYTVGTDLDSLIEDILNRERIKSIINGEYIKNTEEKWTFKGMSLVQYIELNIKSEYRSPKQIRQNIEDYVSAKIKRENLSSSNREELIELYIESEIFKKFLTTPPTKRLSFFYNGERLYHYLKRVIVDKSNLNYIYCLIIGRISKIYNLDSTKDLDTIVNQVMISAEIINLINTNNANKIERENWPFQEGLLIDYLKSIDLNGKKLITVYLQVKSYINRRNPLGFKTLTEKRLAIENYVNSEYFANYIKYGYTNKTYFYKGMLLIDYIQLNYGEVLRVQFKTPDNLYHKIITMISSQWDIDSLSPDEIEQLIDKALKSDEIKIYLNKKKMVFESWAYNNRNLKDVILEVFREIIEDDSDLYRIYQTITSRARKTKLENPEMDNNDIISYFFTEEFVKNFKEASIRRKKIKEEVEKKADLYNNKDDYDYICLYAVDNHLDIDEINRISKQGFNYYSAIIILEYSLKYDTSVDELISFTLNVDEGSDNYLLWLFKLGFRDYISDVLKKNKKLINLWIYKLVLTIFNGSNNISFEDLYSSLTELLITKHIGITVSIDNLFFSFRSFTQSCIKRYLLDFKRRDNKFKGIQSLDDEDFYIQLQSDDNVEDEYIDSEENDIINGAIDKLDELEREFIDLRYGFSSNPHDLHEIKKIWESKEIFVSLEELEQMDIEVLNKLRSNPNILSLNSQLRN